MDNHGKKISYACQLCPDIRQDLGPYEVSKINQLKIHMAKIHNVDVIRTNWDKYLKFCKKESPVENLGSNLNIKSPNGMNTFHHKISKCSQTEVVLSVLLDVGTLSCWLSLSMIFGITCEWMATYFG